MMDFIFNGISASSIGIKVLNTKRSILPDIRDQYETVPGKIGSYLFAQPFGDRIIEIECAFVSQTADTILQDARKISAWLSTNKKAQLILSKEADKYYMAKVSNKVDIDQTLYLGQFSIQFTCEPFAYSLDDNIQQFTAQPGATQGIYNNGTAETNPVISIIAAWGDVKNPKITLNDVIFLYNGTITSNSQIDINSETFTCYKGMDRDINTTGGYDPAEDSILALIDGEFPTLQPGPNSLIFNCDNGVNADIKIQFKERWI